MSYALGLTASAPPDHLAADMRRYRDEPLDLLTDAHVLLRLAACAWRLASDGEASLSEVAALLEQDQANLTARLQRAKVPDLAPTDHRSEADLRRVIERSRALEAALLPLADAESAATALAVLERLLPQWLGHGVLPLWLESDASLSIHGTSDLAGQRLRVRGRRSLAATAVACGEVTVLRVAADPQATAAPSDWSASDSYASEGFAQDSYAPDAQVKVTVFDRQCAERLGVSALAALPVGAPDPVAVLLTNADVEADELKLVRVHAARWLTRFAAVEGRLQQAADEQRAGFSLRMREAVHEISNPLSVMQNYLHLLGNRIGGDDSAKEKVGLISDELRRAASLLRNLTDEERTHPVTAREKEGADLNAMVADVLALLEGSPNAANAPIDIRFTPALDLPPLTVADHRLRQVLLNLSKNALEAMPQGGILDVVVDQSVTDGGRRGVEIAVSDTGKGIEPTLLDRIFESGVSVKGEGRGLGLAITRRLVHELGGEISCRSRVGAGTTFVVWLPAV